MVLEAKALAQLRTRQGSASKETKRLDNRNRQLRAQVTEMLHELYVWQVIGTQLTVSEVALSKERVKELYTDDGVGPWHEASAGGRLYYGRLFHRLDSDRARCEESLAVLNTERRRLQRWVTWHMRQVVAAEAEATAADELGRAMLLRRHKLMLEGMQSAMDNLIWV
jgi:hypothetical protein